MSDSPYKMSISLNVLNHLGINLYSNVPAVLSELVANAWDADANTVFINFGDDYIVIEDDGHGMTQSEINERFLTVGYQRRKKQPPITDKKRQPMGRKGIGKLAVFSIADTVEVYSAKDGERNGLLMSRPEIQKVIEGKTDQASIYMPVFIPTPEIEISKGTKLVLSDLRANRKASLSVPYLKQRLARRFTVIGARYGFQIFINNEEVTPKDRAFYQHLEFIWFFGAIDEEIKKHCRPDVHIEILSDTIEGASELKVRGWIGTVVEPRNLGDPADNGNSIVIYTRGKLVQENILPEFKEARVFAQYIVGDVEADFIDIDDLDDLATSDRQRIVSEDPRYRNLKNHLHAAVKKIGLRWTDLRNAQGAKKALQNPIIKEWVSEMTPDNQQQAEKMFGRIEAIPYTDNKAKAEMYRASMMAFEKMALVGQLSALETIDTQDGLEVLLAIFKSVDDIEAAHYYEIARGRLKVISEFADLIDAEKQERVLQRYLFEHLWLLDASWERATNTERMEQSIHTEFDKVTKLLSDEERRGRVDIRYKTLGGKHVIVEMKKADVTIDVYILGAQLSKYKTALQKALRLYYPDQLNWHIEVVCVLGRQPTPTEDPQQVVNVLSALNARYVTYNQLITGAQTAYADYLEREKRFSVFAQRLDKLYKSFDVDDSLALPSP